MFKKSGPCYFLSLSLPFFLTVCLFSASSTWKCFFFLSFELLLHHHQKAFHVEAREEKLQAFNIQTSRALSLIGTRLPSKKPSGDDQPSFFFWCWRHLHMLSMPGQEVEKDSVRSGQLGSWLSPCSDGSRLSAVCSTSFCGRVHLIIIC